MSKYIDEIVEKIRKYPNIWIDIQDGITDGNIIISCYGNTKVLSIIDVHIDGIEKPTTYIDRWRLESALGNWYRTVSLKTISIRL